MQGRDRPGINGDGASRGETPAQPGLAGIGAIAGLEQCADIGQRIAFQRMVFPAGNDGKFDAGKIGNFCGFQLGNHPARAEAGG